MHVILQNHVLGRAANNVASPCTFDQIGHQSYCFNRRFQGLLICTTAPCCHCCARSIRTAVVKANVTGPFCPARHVFVLYHAAGSLVLPANFCSRLTSWPFFALQAIARAKAKMPRSGRGTCIRYHLIRVAIRHIL